MERVTFTMDYKPETSSGSKERSTPGTRKFFLYVVVFLIICTYSLCQKRILMKEVTKQTVTTEMVDKSSENEMSAIRFTTWPFILAFKHFVVDREE
ncbi:MAG: hypothetical protein KFF73_10205 [Cyclobacteriaceae bacterium]|nr:hypothetical protein [Cyclobacteriaceae bacterium]